VGKQFLIWFAAALVGGLLMLTIGSYLGIGGLPPRAAELVFASHADAAATANEPPASDPAAAASALKPGDQVPAAFALPDLDGKRQLLAQYRGHRVLLNFWATWCHPCLEEMPQLAAAQKAHPHARIIGIAMDSPEAVHRWLKHTPVGYPIWLGLSGDDDPSALFGDSAGLLPYSVLIGRNGEVRATHMGKLTPERLTQWLAGNP
jgi:thiol-disulfide isomerase/thioredoxin